MSYMVARPDHCKTAQDVHIAAIRVSEFRRGSRPHQEPFIIHLVKAAEFMPKPAVELPKPIPGPVIDPLPTEIRIIDIQNAICRKFLIPMNEFLSERRDRRLTVPRQVSWVLCRILTLRSYPDIGRRTGGRDHTTVLHGIRKFDWLYKQLSSELNTFQPLSTWVNRAHEILVEKEIILGKA